MRKAKQYNGSPEKRLTVFVPCPVQRGTYAGWEMQLARFAARNRNVNDFRFIHAKAPLNGCGLFGSAYAALTYALDCRRQILAQTGPVVVLFPVFFLANVLLSLLLPYRTPFIARISGNELARGNSLAYALRLRQIRKARRVVALNSADFEKLGQLGISKDCQAQIPNPVGSNFRPPQAEERIVARAALGLTADQIAIGCVGAICPRKRQRLLIAAAKALLTHNNVVVVLCGPEDGPSEADSTYAAACRKDAERLSVPLIMTGQREDVQDVLWALDVFTLPSVQEGMPNALLEALACGLPCIGADIPGIRDLLGFNSRSSLFPMDCVQAFTRAITEKLSKHNHADVQLNLVAEHRAEVLDVRLLSLIRAVADRQSNRPL